MHFGRSAGFVIFEVEGAQVSRAEMRTNRHSAHAQGLCGGEEHGHGEAGHGHGEHGSHSHAGLVGLLQGCEVVLCGGMGAGAAQALRQNRIQPVIVAGPESAEAAVEQYARGDFKASSAGFCGCT